MARKDDVFFNKGLWEKCVKKDASVMRSSNAFIGIPAQFLDAKISEFVGHEDARKKVKALMRKAPMIWAQGNNLILFGKRGNGKSFLAACVAMNANQYHEHTVRFISQGELLRILSDTRFSNRAEEEDLKRVEALRDCELLVIDGFLDGHEERFNKLLSSFIADRTNQGDTSTLLTTSIDLSTEEGWEEVEGFCGKGFVGLLEDRFIPVEVKGGSLRAKLRSSDARRLFE